MFAIFKFVLFITALAGLTLWFGDGLKPNDNPMESESSPLLNTIDAANKAADQLER